MRAAPDVGQVILRVLTIKPLCNYRDSLRVISGHGTGGRSSYPRVPTLRDVRKVPFGVVAMLPDGLGERRSRSWRGRHDGELLPAMRAELHIRIVAARLVAIVPDGPWPRLAGSTVAGRGWPTR